MPKFAVRADGRSLSLETSNCCLVKAARRCRQRTRDGTRISVLDSRPRPMQFMAPTSVRSFLISQRTATHGICTDKKCPFTGSVSIRGRILTGKVVSTKMTRTIVIRRDYLHYIPKYSGSRALSDPVWCSDTCAQTVMKNDTRTWLHMYRQHSV